MIGKVAIYSFILLLAACDTVSVEEVEARFKQDNPDVILMSVIPTEGDSDSLYFLIKYKDNLLTKSEEWLYQKNKNSEWVVTKKR